MKAFAALMVLFGALKWFLSPGKYPPGVTPVEESTREETTVIGPEEPGFTEVIIGPTRPIVIPPPLIVEPKPLAEMTTAEAVSIIQQIPGISGGVEPGIPGYPPFYPQYTQAAIQQALTTIAQAEAGIAQAVAPTFPAGTDPAWVIAQLKALGYL